MTLLSYNNFSSVTNTFQTIKTTLEKAFRFVRYEFYLFEWHEDCHLFLSVTEINFLVEST